MSAEACLFARDGMIDRMKEILDLMEIDKGIERDSRSNDSLK